MHDGKHRADEREHHVEVDIVNYLNEGLEQAAPNRSMKQHDWDEPKHRLDYVPTPIFLEVYNVYEEIYDFKHQTVDLGTHQPSFLGVLTNS